MLNVIKKVALYTCSVLVAVLIMYFVNFTNKYSLEPREVYKVYLDGKVIGNIKDKKALEDYINSEQQELKEKYDVAKVYVPSGVDIEKCTTYENKVLTAKQVNNIIKKKKPFTVKGYKVTINPSTTHKDKIIINVLDKKTFDAAMKTVLKAFVSSDDITNYQNDTQPEIKNTGSLIEDIYLGEDVTIKRSYISTNEEIFNDEKTLTKYLLFGSLKDDQYYTVKEGDTIESIAYNNKLAPEEFLIVNPEFTSKTNLLSPGQQVKIGLIDPLVDIVVERHTVLDQESKYQTETEYDDNAYQGTETVKTEGQNGTNRVTMKIKTVNGQTTNAVIVSSETLTPTVNRVVVDGTKTASGYSSQVVAAGAWAWPTISPYYISSYYGYRWGILHPAIDITGCGSGSPIYAANDGTVMNFLSIWDLGKHVIINHGNGYYTVYEHLSFVSVTPGQTVTKGQQIGGMGSTGDSTGTHLHFGVYVGGAPYGGGGTPINPLTLYQ